MNIKGYSVLVDTGDEEKICGHRWCVAKFGDGLFYAYRWSRNGQIYMHRLITDCPKGMSVDHINGNGLDNRRSNLRICEHGENLLNCRVRKDSGTGLKGVTVVGKYKDRFSAHIHVGGIHKRLGWYETAEEAARVYDEVARAAFGEYARTNY